MTQIIAHRGHSSLYRENSAPAWRSAMTSDADIIEIDVRRSLDGIFVCTHDPGLGIVDRPETIAELHFEDICKIVVDGQCLASPLVDAFDVIPATTGILFDVKDESRTTLMALLDFAHLFPLHRLIFGLHDLSSIRFVRKFANIEVLGLLDGDEVDDDPFFDIGGNVLRLWESMATPQRIARLKAKERVVWVTTGGWGTGREVGDFATHILRDHQRAGIDGFLVNDPANARAALCINAN